MKSTFLQKLFYINVLCLLLMNNALSQNVGIGTTTPNASAKVDIQSTNGGILIPRMSTAQRTGIASPANGLLVFDNTTNSFWYYSSSWVELLTAGNTLDNAYDEGGVGSGRTITADNGSVIVQGSDGFAVTGTYGSGTTVGTPGAGTRMIFNPNKGAFRAGRVSGSHWDNNNLGSYSAAFGYNTIASGDYAIATGFSTASGDHSASFGYGTSASGNRSFSGGNYTTASGLYSVAFGSFTTASGGASTAIGNGSTASGDCSIAAVSSTSSGNYSCGIGLGILAESFGEIALGYYNTNYTPVSQTFANSADRLFVIGNGTGAARSDALVMLKSGYTGIGTSSPDRLLEISGSGEINTRITSSDASNAAIELKNAGAGTADWKIAANSSGNFLISSSSDDLATINTDGILLSGSLFRPRADNTLSLGNSSYRWTEVFAANGTINTSDIRLKKEIAAIPYGLDQVNQLKPVCFRWVSGNKNDIKLGLIAQEVNEIIPEVVLEGDDESYWGLNYSDLIPVLIKAVQELNDQNQQLLREIRDLKLRLKVLEEE